MNGIVLKIKNVAAGFVASILSGLNISAIEIDAGSAPHSASPAVDNATGYTGSAKTKTDYNLAIAKARDAVTEALKLRREIVREYPQYRGPSMGHLRLATLALYNASTFDGFPGDTPESMNPVRDTDAYDLESFDFSGVKNAIA